MKLSPKSTGLRVNVSWWRGIVFAVLVIAVVSGTRAAYAAPAPDDFFRIKVVDEETGKGVPMMKLKLNNNITFFTDSQGIAAIREPGLMDGPKVRVDFVFLGYRYRQRFFDTDIFLKGKAFTFDTGDSVTVSVDRDMVAERLYRMTGAGIYRDSVLVGEPVPTDEPLINANVVTTGDMRSAVFNGKLFWFWSYGAGEPDSVFGHTGVAGATSQLPKYAGVDPAVGVNLDYFTTSEGTSREMFPNVDEGPVALHSLMVTSSGGTTKMFTYYRVDKQWGFQDVVSGSSPRIVEHGIAKWDEASQEFNVVVTFPTDMKARICPNATRVRNEGKEWFYFSCPLPLTRVPATAAALKDPNQYQTFTPIKSGEGWQGASSTPIKRGWLKTPDWRWDTGTATVDNIRESLLIQAGRMTWKQGIHHLTDVVSGDTLAVLMGTVNWNAYRQKWTMVATEVFGRSTAGEVWYAEADSPIGPWVYTREVATHYQNESDSYVFANPKQHPYFNSPGDTYVLFSGLFTSFSDITRRVPRYNQNQLMYGLDLTDLRLHLPTPVYLYPDRDGNIHYGTGRPLSDDQRDSGIVPFFAYAADRHHRSDTATTPSDAPTIPIWETTESVNGTVKTTLTPDSSAATSDTPAFYAFPPDATTDHPDVLKLNQYDTTTQRVYAPAQYGNRLVEKKGWTNNGTVAKVWSSPRLAPPKDSYAEPVKQCLGSFAVCE